MLKKTIAIGRASNIRLHYPRTFGQVATSPVLRSANTVASSRQYNVQKITTQNKGTLKQDCHLAPIAYTRLLFTFSFYTTSTAIKKRNNNKI